MKKYNVALSERFKKEFRKLDKYTQKMIRGWIDKILLEHQIPAYMEKVWLPIEVGSGGIESVIIVLYAK